MKWGDVMRKIQLFLLAVVLAIVPGAPVCADGWGESSLCDYKQYGLDGDKFFLYFTKDTPYPSWQLWPDKGKLRAAEEPHGAFLTTYVNPAAYRSITRKEGMAYGSLVVTENRDADMRLLNLTAKIKIKGYNPPGGDWYWFQYTPEGKIMAEGKAGACIACHGKRETNDFVMTAPVR